MRQIHQPETAHFSVQSFKILSMLHLLLFQKYILKKKPLQLHSAKKKAISELLSVLIMYQALVILHTPAADLLVRTPASVRLLEGMSTWSCQTGARMPSA